MFAFQMVVGTSPQTEHHYQKNNQLCHIHRYASTYIDHMVLASLPLPESKKKHLGAYQSGYCGGAGGVPGADMAKCLKE